LRNELAEMQDDPERAELAKKVQEMTHRIDQAGAVLFQDVGYALLRAKLLARMVISVGAATELLHQAGADPERRALAEAYIARHGLEVDHLARRIEENAEGRVESDARVLALAE
jgi:hypothetical protein